MEKAIEKAIFCLTECGPRAVLGKEIKIDSLPDEKFFVHVSVGEPSKKERFSVTHEASGFRVSAGPSSKKAEEEARDKLRNISSDQLRSKIDLMAQNYEHKGERALRICLSEIGIDITLVQASRLKERLSAMGMLII